VFKDMQVFNQNITFKGQNYSVYNLKTDPEPYIHLVKDIQKKMTSRTNKKYLSKFPHYVARNASEVDREINDLAKMKTDNVPRYWLLRHVFKDLSQSDINMILSYDLFKKMSNDELFFFFSKVDIFNNLSRDETFKKLDTFFLFLYLFIMGREDASISDYSVKNMKDVLESKEIANFDVVNFWDLDKVKNISSKVSKENCNRIILKDVEKFIQASPYISILGDDFLNFVLSNNEYYSYSTKVSNEILKEHERLLPYSLLSDSKRYDLMRVLLSNKSRDIDEIILLADELVLSDNISIKSEEKVLHIYKYILHFFGKEEGISIIKELNSLNKNLLFFVKYIRIARENPLPSSVLINLV